MIAPIEDLLTFSGIEDVEVPCDYNDCLIAAEWVSHCRTCPEFALQCDMHMRAEFDESARIESKGSHPYCRSCLTEAPTLARLIVVTPINHRPKDRP